MATFFDNLRKATSLSNKGTPTGVSTWDPEKISEVLEERWAGLDKTENPNVSLNVDIPKTPSVVKIQTGKYRLDNDTNTTGINNDNALYIVGNTYQDNNNGIYYGMGWDGRPYSYTIKDNVVGNFAPLGIDEQKKAISKLSDGKITVHDSVTNPATLAQIYRSVKRMKDSGNLVTDHVVIGDSFPDSNGNPDDPSLGGVMRPNIGTTSRPHHIDLMGTNFPAEQTKAVNKGFRSGFHSVSGPDVITQHELAHAAEASLLGAPYRYVQQVAEDNRKNEGKYRASDLWADAIGKIKYAIPVLSDAVFGTHLVPSEDDVYAMYDSSNPAFSDLAHYWLDYYTSPAEKFSSVAWHNVDKADKKAAEWTEKFEPDSGTLQESLFKKAAENTGFDSVEDAVKSISGYAATNNTEAFAEAYSDVLLNGKNAKDFSKELIRLYSEIADETAKMFGKNKPTQLTILQNLIDVVPQDSLTTPFGQKNAFQTNLQKLKK